ncbi:uncharacterized protein Z518_10229 [Rhinocladiella mackenziei CBS 650.93]|uniref:sarcosine oxidasee (formaldehyde-forming) n=1 Tax=Rhinocladiella mackenziei CBS 650.93 TaxID=1442369 RepID=A0A0D2FDC5_9EURO|nr:uncharacterized protein Z518_10229 [Rhinocladiella mackenziei CBS 650.93]KIX00092.1 hypothetical protein Z518_10229 [Rhinocladiella mackenziei CBS 650.93]
MEHFDVAIVGLGALGSAAAYQAARKGAKVVAFEQFELGHVHGSSHDTSRIVRTSYGSPEYVALAKAAYKDWADLEKAAGLKLLTVTGGVTFLNKDGPTPASDYARSLDANNIPYELLDAAEVHRRWPQFQVGDDIVTVYTADSGIVHAAKSVTAMQYVARSYGAVLKERTRVESVKPQTSGKGVILETSQGQFHAAKVILAADAWTNKLLAPLGAEIPLAVTQEQVTYFKPTDTAAFKSDRFPVWIWGKDLWFYGFPCFGEPTIKAGRDNAENFMTPEQRTYVHSPKLFQQLSCFLDKLIPDKDRLPLRTVTCQYTITPDRQFIISPLEKHHDIIVGLGAAHAFKFAPAFGRVLAELAIDGRTKEDISSFGIPTKAPSLTSKL